MADLSSLIYPDAVSSPHRDGDGAEMPVQGSRLACPAGSWRGLAPLLAPLALCVLTLIISARVLYMPASLHQVSSVAVARATLTHMPERWVGRTVYVRGRLDGCPPAPSACPIRQPRLLDPTPAAGRGALAVALLPRPQALPWGTVGTYSVQVQAQPRTPCLGYRCGRDIDLAAFSCAGRACYTAVVFAGAGE